jgi:hypothetical protein
MLMLCSSAGGTHSDFCACGRRCRHISAAALNNPKVLSSKVWVYKPTRLQPTVSLLVIRLTGVETALLPHFCCCSQVLSSKVWVYKPTRLQPTVSLLVTRLTGVETNVNIPASDLVLRFATTCLTYQHRANLFTLCRFVSCCCISREETRTIRCDSSTRLITLLGLGLGRITVVHPLPSGAVKPGPRKID